MLAIERGRADSPNGAYRFADCDRPQWRRRENICAYILRRSEVSDLRSRKSIGGGRPGCLEAAFSREVKTKEKQRRSSPRHRISRPFLQLKFAPTNPLKFQRRNSCAKFLNYARHHVCLCSYSQYLGRICTTACKSIACTLVADRVAGGRNATCRHQIPIVSISTGIGR